MHPISYSILPRFYKVEQARTRINKNNLIKQYQQSKVINKDKQLLIKQIENQIKVLKSHIKPCKGFN